ncbi:MAG: hypothetical protein MJ171_08020 [Clostridia bacterium]|nr:hypothetical protein [Clostridia bacterium]
MKKNLTELVFILDRSGSMAGLETDTIGGFNGMIEKQKKEEGEALVTTVLFSTELSTLHDRVDLKEVEKMTEEEYYVGGCTALYDAIGCSIKHIEKIHKYIRPEDVPENTLFVITTDGFENASKKYDREKLKKLIEKKEEEGWKFLFLGANIDAEETAEHIGIKRSNAVEYINDESGIGAVFESVNTAVCAMRAEACIAPDWKAKVVANRKARR